MKKTNLKRVSLFKPVMYNRDLASLDGLIQKVYLNSQNPRSVSQDLKKAGLYDHLDIDFDRLEKEAIDIKTANTAFPL